MRDFRQVARDWVFTTGSVTKEHVGIYKTAVVFNSFGLTKVEQNVKRLSVTFISLLAHLDLSYTAKQ